MTFDPIEMFMTDAITVDELERYLAIAGHPMHGLVKKLIDREAAELADEERGIRDRAYDDGHEAGEEGEWSDWTKAVGDLVRDINAGRRSPEWIALMTSQRDAYAVIDALGDRIVPLLKTIKDD